MNFEIIKKKFKDYNYSFLILGSFFLIGNIYLRFFRQKDELLLITWKANLTIFGLFLVVFFFIFQLCFFILSIYTIYKNYFNKKKNLNLRFFSSISNIINKYYWKPLEYIFDLIAPRIPGSGKFFLWTHYTLEEGPHEITYGFYYNSFFIFDYFPSLILSSIFFYEIVILEKLYYFFYTIPFMLIPIIYTIYLKLCLSFHDRNINGFDEKIQFLYYDKENNKFTFAWKPNYTQNSNELLEDTAKGWLALKRIQFNVNKIVQKKDYYYPYFLLLTSAMYVVGGFYRLYFYFC